MNSFSEAKKIYNAVEIPKELEKTVNDAIQNSAVTGRRKSNVMIRRVGKTATAICVVFCLIISINFIKSQNFQTFLPFGNNADEASYDSAFSMTSRSNNAPDAVDRRIEKALSEHVAQAERNYNKFLSANGHADDTVTNDFGIVADYDMLYESEEVASFVITVEEPWEDSGRKKFYYNVSVSDGADITLSDFLGMAYDGNAEMQKKSATPRAASEESGDAESVFYINARGNAVVISESGHEQEIIR